jgi:hypothetical protein
MLAVVLRVHRHRPARLGPNGLTVGCANTHHSLVQVPGLRPYLHALGTTADPWTIAGSFESLCIRQYLMRLGHHMVCFTMVSGRARTI